MQSRKILIIVHKKHLYVLSFISLLIIVILYLAQLIYSNPENSETSTFFDNNISFLPASSNIQNPKLAIIIDDFGLDRNGIEEMMTMNRHLTFAIMPFLKYSKQDAIAAHAKGYEVIVHLPMQSEKIDIPEWLGPKPIKVNLSDSEIEKIVADSLNSIPYTAGLNIHMGALASENKRVVSDVMKVVKRKGLYFVDSVTSPRTVCRSVAQTIGVRFIERNVFLEGTSKNRTKAYVKHQLAAAENLALKNGYAVAIGHVGSAGGKVTVQAIKEMIPELERKGIKLVYVSELLR